MKIEWDRKQASLGMVAASVLMLTSGLTYRVTASRLGDCVSTPPIAPNALDGFPMQISDWQGQDIPVDEGVVNRTGTDAHIHRQYSRRSGLESISLYIACGVRIDQVMGHLPEGCYRAAGWTLVDCRSMELAGTHGGRLPCIVFEAVRGGLDTRKIVVLHYFVVDGQYRNDISPLQSRVWRVFAMASYVAQVQIVASSEPSASGSATNLVVEFAVDSTAAVARLFEDLKREGPGKE